MNKWILPNEQMPEENQTVLATVIDKDNIEEDGIIDDWVDVLYFQYGFWNVYNSDVEYETKDIRAWQPIPEPYKTKRKRGKKNE